MHTAISEDWSRASWYVVFGGIADAYLWGFDADRAWRLRHDNPARGTLAILPMRKRDRRATLEDATWLADCIAFDHDAPVGLIPSRSNRRAVYPSAPVIPVVGSEAAVWYFRDLAQAYDAAAEIRFGASYCLRYDAEEDDPPNTDFGDRFRGREHLVSLYAMASRQADILSEYLCLYRVLEAADGGNGKAFVAAHLEELRQHNFGVLRVVPPWPAIDWLNAFEVYRARAIMELRRLQSGERRDPAAVSAHLYSVRNSLAHGKGRIRTVDFKAGVAEVARALPIVKLLARIAVASSRAAEPVR